MYIYFNEKEQTEAHIENPIKRNLNKALFDLDSRLGRNVNLLGIVVIVFTVVLSMIGTIKNIPEGIRSGIQWIELIITFAFAIEYFLRIIAARKPLAYIFGFYGLIDLLTWLPILLIGDSTLAIRLLRVLRLLKLIRYLRALHLFLSSLRDTVEIMLVVIFTMLIMIAISGNLIHAIEPETIPNAFVGSWWSLVKMTTVGYGDIVPVTTGGKLIASILMIIGITLFAMLTGTISVKIAQIVNHNHTCKNCLNKISNEFGFCPHCGVEQLDNHNLTCVKCHSDIEAEDKYCSNCGMKATMNQS